MRERLIKKDGQSVIEVRSDGGRLLFLKTKQGYEMKCPRTKRIYLVRYEDMLVDCFESLEILQECFKALEDNFKRMELLRKHKSIESK